MESALHVAADHPAYAGHFPGRPILPGVVLVAEALDAIAKASGHPIAAWTLAGVKFLHPVVPGTQLTLAHETSDAGGIRFEIRGGGRIVASGNLVPRS